MPGSGASLSASAGGIRKEGAGGSSKLAAGEGSKGVEGESSKVAARGTSKTSAEEGRARAGTNASSGVGEGGSAQKLPSLRLFFALWPDAVTSAALHARARALHAECGGRAMRRDTIHLTLAFLGETPAWEVERLLALAGQVDGEGFALVLDHVGNWKRNRVLWTGPSIIPPALTALAQGLESRLRAAGFVLEERAFSPHVTLVRDARAAPAGPQLAALRWTVASFVLVASERSAAGASYRTIGRWPLKQRG